MIENLFSARSECAGILFRQQESVLFGQEKARCNSIDADAGEYSCAICTASHCVKLLTAAFAAEYAGMRVSGRKAFMEETLRIIPSFCLAIFLPKTWLGRIVPIRFRFETN